MSFIQKKKLLPFLQLNCAAKINDKQDFSYDKLLFFIKKNISFKTTTKQNMIHTQKQIAPTNALLFLTLTASFLFC